MKVTLVTPAVICAVEFLAIILVTPSIHFPVCGGEMYRKKST